MQIKPLINVHRIVEVILNVCADFADDIGANAVEAAIASNDKVASEGSLGFSFTLTAQREAYHPRQPD